MMEHSRIEAYSLPHWPMTSLLLLNTNCTETWEYSRGSPSVAMVMLYFESLEGMLVQTRDEKEHYERMTVSHEDD